MAAANSALQISNLDFSSIKTSLKTFLQQQDTLKDYNFDASALSVLVDLLAYNTQYNSYYLNMVANEMFLDSAIQRGSVVSHAKLLNYTPKSASAPVATVNLRVNEVTTPTLTAPKYTQFISEAIDSVNYSFVTTDAVTVPVNAGVATFDNLEIRQGIPASFKYTVDTTSNPKNLFQIPDAKIDTSTLVVTVQDSISNSTFEVYNLATDYVSLTPSSKVYFLQEGRNGNYEMYFGDGILGYAPVNGNIVNISYIITNGSASFGANSFTLMASVGGFSNTVITTVASATKGSERETVDSIKFTAPKAYAAQGRAVTKEDYIYLIQNNSTSIPIDAVSVWGGEENTPPVYGQLFCAVKPSGGYTLTTTQKDKLINEVIRPISVVTVRPVIVDPDYNYVRVDSTVLYDSKKTTSTANQIKQAVTAAIQSFGRSTLNTFNSTLKMPDMSNIIQTTDSSIVTNDTSIRVQKKFYPNLTSSTTYVLDYGVPLKRNFFNAGVTTSPGITVRDINAIRTGVYFEEVPTTVGGIAKINIVSQGFSYQTTPTVTITGDGTGATAYAVLSGGRVSEIVLTNGGSNYTQAIVTITPAAQDSSGGFAFADAVVEGSVGVLRTFYYENNVKTILNANAGTIDYLNGKVTLTDFNPIAVNNDLGQFTVSVVPDSTILSSTYNKIITIDEFDPDSVVVKVNAV